METTTTTIRPNPAMMGKVTKLNHIDQIAPRDYVASYFFFRLPNGTDKLALFRCIEQGVYTSVSQIPDLMCCICKSEGDRDELELRLHGDSGATITMKDFTNNSLGYQWSPGTFDDLDRAHFPLQSLPQEHVLAQTEFPGQACRPTLAMQANFIEGGLILTGCLHHTVCDGTGGIVFYTILAQHITAATTGEQPNPLTDSAISFLDRKSIIEPEVDVLLNEFPDWKIAQDHAAFLNPCDYDPELSPPVQFATYFISGQKLQDLKQRFSTGSGKIPSSTETACAFLWKHVVRARGIDCVRYPETKLSIPVNTRARMKNPLCSPAYWGNLSEPNAVARMPTRDFCGAPTTPSTTLPPIGPTSDADKALNTTDLAAEIFQPQTTTPQPQTAGQPHLSTAANRIKQAIAAVDSTAVRRLVGLLNQMDKATSLTWNVDRWPGPDMLIVCLNASKLNHIDFGPAFGFSEAFRCSIGKPDGKPDGRCFIWPPRQRDGKGIEVTLQYDAGTLGRLRACEELREFFEWRN